MARCSRRLHTEDITVPINNITYRAAIYARLSGISKQKESDSIANQIKLIRRYISEEKTIAICGEYTDDGYSGTNFNRPAFSAMLEDAKKGMINCIIVKDLSRLGRDYIETGYYLEKIFPHMGIRFIAVNDQYDSQAKEISQDFLLLGLKNLINEMYAKDISKKISTSYTVAKKGKSVFGVMPPYGYIIHENKKNGLLIDSETAPVVKKIYHLYLQGDSYRSISKILNESNTEPPFHYFMRKRGKSTQRGIYWQPATIKNILSNPTYTGAIVRNKTKTSKFENRPTTRNLPEEWELIPNMHEAIIHQNVFDKVKKMRENGFHITERR